MNAYTVSFYATCPANDVRIAYTLRIELTLADQRHTVPVEELVAVVSQFTRGYHESLADRLYHMFGGVQTLTATHHGVDIETRRPYYGERATK